MVCAGLMENVVETAPRSLDFYDGAAYISEESIFYDNAVAFRAHRLILKERVNV